MEWLFSGGLLAGLAGGFIVVLGVTRAKSGAQLMLDKYQELLDEARAEDEESEN